MKRQSNRTEKALTHIHRHLAYCCATVLYPLSEQIESAREDGFDDKDIIAEGRGGESFEFAASCYRGRGGRMALYGGGLFTLGNRIGAIANRVIFLEALNIAPYDGRSKETSGALLMRKASATINGLKSLRPGTKRTRLISARGGKAKAAHAADRRDKLAAPVVTQAIMDAPELTMARKAEILQTSKSSLRRHAASI